MDPASEEVRPPQPPDPAARGAPALELAIIANSNTPYRLHSHLRIARELAAVHLWSVFTHDVSNAPWALALPPEINAISFGPGEASDAAASPARALHEWRKGGRIIEWIRTQKIGAVVIWGYNDPGRLRIIQWCARHGVPLLLAADSNIRGDRATGGRALLKREVVSGVAKRSCAILPCGRLGRAYFEKYGARPESIFYFPYEPDYQEIRQVSPEMVDQAARRFSLDRARRRIIYSGRLVHVKRVDLLLDAFAAIAQQRPEWDLLIIGDGPLRDDLHARIPEKLRGRVTWTGFLGDQQTVSALYRLGDLLVLPSDYEPWGLVINEAAAAGLAIVSTSVVGAAFELVREAVNGYVFEPGDKPALTQRLLDSTQAARIDTLRAASPQVLQEWRAVADPVQGLRSALRYCGVVP